MVDISFGVFYERDKSKGVNGTLVWCLRVGFCRKLQFKASRSVIKSPKPGELYNF